MLKFLYKLYFIRFKLKRLDNLWGRVFIRFNNIIFPPYFSITGFRFSNKLANSKMTDGLFIVSLTSFPARIQKVWLTIETILRQKVKPDRIILWLYRGDFNGEQSLPKNLLRLEKRGLEIRFCDENLMPHLKYFYTIIENPDAHVITIDDDMFYPPDLIEKLKYWHEIYPESIISTVVRQIEISENKISSYNEWRYLFNNTIPSFLNLTMGVGGALYPKRSLHADAFELVTLKRISLKTDDIWLKVMSLRCNTRVTSIAGEFTRFFVPIIIKNNVCLMSDNLSHGRNDVAFRALLDQFMLTESILKED